jgi:endonuclease/exonuclease/phosphatase family metal-dependent hydrolase
MINRMIFLVLTAALAAASQPISAQGKGLTVLTINVWSGLDQNTNIQLQRRTYPNEVPEDPRNKRIDYIFVRGTELRVSRARAVLDRPINGQYSSDHFGVLAKIEVR